MYFVLYTKVSKSYLIYSVLLKVTDMRGKLFVNWCSNHLPYQYKTPEKLCNYLQRTFHTILITFYCSKNSKLVYHLKDYSSIYIITMKFLYAIGQTVIWLLPLAAMIMS